MWVRFPSEKLNISIISLASKCNWVPSHNTNCRLIWVEDGERVLTPRCPYLPCYIWDLLRKKNPKTNQNNIVTTNGIHFYLPLVFDPTWFIGVGRKFISSIQPLMGKIYDDLKSEMWRHDSFDSLNVCTWSEAFALPISH